MKELDRLLQNNDINIYMFKHEPINDIEKPTFRMELEVLGTHQKVTRKFFYADTTEKLFEQAYNFLKDVE